MDNGGNTELNEQRELGIKPIPKLFYKYTLITLIGMLAQCVMVLFEGFIIGRGMGAEGLASVGIIMPLEYLMLALGGFFSIGISTVAAMKLGNNDSEGARQAYGQGLLFSTIFMVILSALIFIFAGQVASLLGAPEGLKGPVTNFVRIFMIGYPFCIIGHIATYMARVDEKPGVATFALTFSSIAALGWLYLSVFKLNLGITGTAAYYASSIGLWSVAILVFIFDKKTIFKVKKTDFKFSKELILSIMKIGLPFLVVQVSSSIFTLVINNLFGRFGGELDIAAFAVINSYIVYILMMIANSSVGGLQPIASFNYGAKLFSRVKNLIKVGILGNLVLIYVFAFFFFLFARPITAFFCGDNIELIKISTKATRLLVLFSALGLTSSLMSGYFQAVDRVLNSTILGVCRYIFFAIPFAFILTSIFQKDGVWYSQPIADVCAFLLTIFLAYKEIKRLNQLDSKSSIEEKIHRNAL